MLDVEQAVTMARPDLPRPTCKVMLVCGPPASGKSTYVNAHAGPDDIVIDLDLIAREQGYGRNRPQDEVGELLRKRNDRLAALASEPRERVAWIIIGAPSRALRQWWCAALGVSPENLIVLIPERAELHRRIRNDPDRKQVRPLHVELIEKWFARERDNNPGMIKGAVSADGYPTDPLHPWNWK
jgi:AAA domain